MIVTEFPRRVREIENTWVPVPGTQDRMAARMFMPEGASVHHQVPAILDRITPPTFPARDFPITDYGAKSGSSDSTAAFAKAVSACAAAGGGRVTVPSGTCCS